MTPELTLPLEIAGPLEVVVATDREWFEAHPHRRYRLRRTRIGEMLPGMILTPGSHTMVVHCGHPSVRFRFNVSCPPLRLRRDTDRCCAEIVEFMGRAGYEINGRPVGEALASFRAGAERLIREAFAKDEPAASASTSAGGRR